MRIRKNYNKVPKAIIDRTEEFNSDCVKVGKKVVVTEGNVSRFQKLGLRIESDKLFFNDKVLPSSKNGRYSNYNCYGRRIRRKDLPMIDKIFCGECYPYGNKNSDKVSYSYTKKVCQAEEWIPSFVNISISIEEKDVNVFDVLFEICDSLDRTEYNFELDLLFYINLLQENVGDFDVYEDEIGANDIDEIQYVDWELLPPGEVDEEFVKKCYDKKSEEQQREILERYNFIKQLGPRNIIKGTSYFSKYFGARFDNDTVVLENVESGNAIYIFHENWEKLTKFSRNDLRRGYSDKVTRIVHTGNWKTVLKYELRKGE